MLHITDIGNFSFYRHIWITKKLCFLDFKIICLQMLRYSHLYQDNSCNKISVCQGMKLTCCSTWEKAVIYTFTFKILDMALKLYLNIIIIFQYWSIFRSDVSQTYKNIYLNLPPFLILGTATGCPTCQWSTTGTPFLFWIWFSLWPRGCKNFFV